jgi:hypothetical protein
MPVLELDERELQAVCGGRSRSDHDWECLEAGGTMGVFFGLASENPFIGAGVGVGTFLWCESDDS